MGAGQRGRGAFSAALLACSAHCLTVLSSVGAGAALGGPDAEESACNAGDAGSIPGLGRSRGEGNDCPLQYSCLGNPMDRGAWWSTVHGVTKTQTRLNSQCFQWGQNVALLEREVLLDCLDQTLWAASQ